ncbi:MAG TPA: efflux RND transporter periplasmic adaptor subunit [Terriglobales bacterium]|nr:efflux RND transporter periplasmic adaptor subunit [Terriglobales bacterium]HTZ47039.1 efflux RND transporter periplasmic adaptor subunit [Verrucomicrobiae bacterium]
MKTTVLLFYAGLALCLAANDGCAPKDQAEEEVKPVVAVTLAKAELSDVNITVSAPATIFGRQQASVAARITAPIRELKVRKGDHVTVGQVLAILDNGDLMAQVHEMRAAVADAEATQATDIDRARGDLAIAEATLNQAKEIYNRRKALFQQGAIPERDLLISQTDFETARLKQQVAARTLENLQKNAGVAQSRLAQARARLANLEAQLSFTEIRSPSGGDVIEQFFFPGDMAQPNTPLFTVADLSVAVARAQVPESDAGDLKTGQGCAFRPADRTSSYQGKITMVNEAVDPARRTVEAWCEIPNSSGALRAAEFGQVQIVTRVEKNQVVVPQSAVQLKEGTQDGWVMVVDDKNIAHKTNIVAGEFFGGKAPIMKGLRAGANVITVGAYGIEDGTEVKVQDKQKTDERKDEGKKG